MINFICCAFGIMFIFEVYYRNNLNRKYEIIQAIRKGEKEQYQLSKQTIDMINVKCHDFRHQIRDMGRYNHIDENVIKNINSYIDIYDSAIKTSNKTLNVILGEKSLICNKYNIKFSCVADGQLISFMEEEDIYSLFGNIIDNAIDAVKELEEDIKKHMASKGLDTADNECYLKYLKKKLNGHEFNFLPVDQQKYFSNSLKNAILTARNSAFSRSFIQNKYVSSK